MNFMSKILSQNHLTFLKNDCIMIKHSSAIFKGAFMLPPISGIYSSIKLN